LPEKLKDMNLVIEITAVGKQEFKTFYSTSLKIMVNEAFGELKVSHDGKGIGKAYVKVFTMNQNG
jgi:hypothetical protein